MSEFNESNTIDTYARDIISTMRKVFFLSIFFVFVSCNHTKTAAVLTFIRKTGAALRAEAGQPAFTTAAMAVTMRIRAEATIQRRGRSLTCWRPYMMPR